MADTNNTETTLTRSNHDGSFCPWANSVWANKFKITSFKSDPWRWNKEWDKVLHTLPSRDVYLTMGRMYRKDSWSPTDISTHTQSLRSGVHDLQNHMMGLDELAKKGDFATAWLLIEEVERKRHLLKGVEETCEHVGFGQDSRALCPEITISSMLKQKGKAFVDFYGTFIKGKDDVGEDALFLLSSEWWEKAVEGIPQSELDKFAEPTFALLTLHRNSFISNFLIRVMLSIVGDMMNGSPGMDPVVNFMKSSPLASAWSKAVSGMREKPIIRCENCTKSPEEIGHNVKFMQCSVCKSKLDFAVHYCSAECQKEDWRNHKTHCGKMRVSKKLPGTAQDPHWAYPDFPDHARHIPTTPDGTVFLNSIGFGTPNIQHKYSPALWRQVSLINADRDADYFLFDENDRPVRFVLYDPWMKMTFRDFRGEILSDDEGHGNDMLSALAEHLIKAMAQKPGLSRESILAQLEREYGGDIATKVAEWEKLAAKNGMSGSTFLEVQSRSMMQALPMLMGRTT